METEHLTRALTGIKGIKEVFDATLKSKEGNIMTVLTGPPLVYIAGEEYSNEYMKKRTQNNIHLRSLRFFPESVDREDHMNYKDLNKEVRIAPSSTKIPEESLVIWDDNFVSIKVDKEDIFIIWTKDSSDIKSKINWFESVWERSN